MARIQIRNKTTGEDQYITQTAIETPITDLEGNYQYKNVEMALQEIGEKIKNGVATPNDIKQIKAMIDIINDNIANIESGGGSGGPSSGIEGIDTEVLKEMVEKYEKGQLGGGGGAVSPTIESEFKDCVIEAGASITIDIFYQSPNLGDGTLYITINNAEIDLYPILKQGNNSITIAAKYLNKASNTITLYAKDRVGMSSNRLSFKVISGGVNLTTSFDYTEDFTVGQTILFPFYTTTELTGTIFLYMTIDGIEQEPIECSNGYNSFYLSDYISTVGSHSFSMYAAIDIYKSSTLNFNVVIASSTELTLSSSTVDGTNFEFGNAIQISYRVSKLGSETFTVDLYLDDNLQRTVTVGTGSYYWTLAGGSVAIGAHTAKIIATSASGDTAQIEIRFNIIQGSFTPITIKKGGLVCWLDSDGNSNEMENNNIWLDKSGCGNNGELIDFNFATNGWNPTITELTPNPDNPEENITTTVEYKGLVCNNGAYVRIPYKPFVNNILNGFTMEIVYTPEHSGNDLARVLEYADVVAPYVGVYVDINEMNIKSEAETTAGSVDLDYESGEIQLDFVIDRENKMCRMYVNGIVSRYWMLSDTTTSKESFAIDNDYIYINHSILSNNYNDGTNIIRKFICYERALSHDEVINNYIANQPDLITMENMYNWNYNTQIPKVKIYGDISNCSSTNPAYVRIAYESTDENKYGASFDMESANSPFYLQGTSSLGYARKNYRFVLIDGNGKEYFHEMFPGNAKSESTYTMKCDYVDSSMCCNLCIAKIANDAVYGPNFTIAQKNDPSRRTSIYGHAIELVNIVNNIEVSLGAYVLILDRYATESMGYNTTEFPNILCIEGEANSDVGASAFFSYSNPEGAGNQFPNEISFLNEGWKIVYPAINEDSYDFAPIKELVNFVDLSSDDDFKDSFTLYFDKESVLRYYLMCMMFACIDDLSKNMHLCRYNDVWYVLPYDLDSSIGGNNEGYLNVPASCEVGVLYDEDDPNKVVEKNHFNSWNSRLWTRVRNTFNADLTNMWTTMRSNGVFNLKNILKYFDEVTNIISPKMYNDSQQIKYIDYGSEGQVALHGNRKHQIRKFLRERMAYLDSKYGFYSDGGTENYVNLRMNTMGNVSLTISTYYPVYYSVKWATGRVETRRIGKGESKTFSYYSDVSTDREVLLYLPECLKKIENLDSLKPASIDINKATKLNAIECHSPNLYSVSLNNNKYLRKVDFNGCNLLGTDTVSTISLLYAKYLNYIDVRGTQLTAINLGTQGGSLKEMYCPSTLTTLSVKNQPLLTDLILPYGTNGSEAAVNLSTIEILNCPNIVRVCENTAINMFETMKYCRNLNLNNSFNLTEISFDGFTRLANVTLSNMSDLQEVSLNNLCVAGETSTLRYIGILSCPNTKEINLNCTSNDYTIAFANNSILDLSTSNVEIINSNCVITGLTTIVLPKSIKEMYFTNEYGSGYSDIRNIWSVGAAVIDSTGVYPVANHMDYTTNTIDDYIGIDFYGLNLKNIDLGALVNIPDAINFSLSPTTVNPNFNLHRDGETYPYLRPSGTLNLSNYTKSLAKFFNGVNLNYLKVTCDNPLPQTDLSYCFYNCTFSNDSQISAILNNISSVSNMDYCFYKTSISDVSILGRINFVNGTSMKYCFAECPNISILSNVTLSSNIGNASYMFSGSGITTVSNLTTSCSNIVGMFSFCPNLLTVENFTATGTTSYESLFEGCGFTVAPLVSIPENIINIKNMYKNCDNLVSIDGFILHGNLTEVTGFIEGCDKLINANNVTIAGPFYNDIFRGITSLKYVNNLLISYVGRSMTFAHMFDGCSNLVEMSFHDDSYVKDVISMDYMFAGTSMRTVDLSNVNFEKVTSIKYMFANGLMEEFSYTVPITIISIQGFLSGCRNLRTLRNFVVPTNVSTLNWLDDTNVENLINCSFNTQYTKFTDKTSLKVVENLEYTGTDFSNYFKGCTSLQRVSLTLPNTATRAESAFANCPNLTQIDFKTSDLSNVTSINGMFNGDTSLTTINNLRITKNSTTADNTTLVGCPINNTDGLYINSNNALNMFRLGAESAITAVTDFELGSNANDLSELFIDNPNITHDITIPSHVHSVEKMYYNCINLTHITSNWSNIYDLNIDTNPNNDVVTANCYGECTNIQYIDNELYMNEYGELTAIYSIPEEWGGILNCSADQTAFYINSDLLTEYTITLNGSDGIYTTDWGDGTVDKRVSHTYSKSGSFRIVTNNSETFGTGSQIPDNFRIAITRVLHLNENITNGSHLFDGCTNLLEIKQLTNSFVNGDYMFNGCSNLLDINGGITISSGTTMAYMCNDCAKFTKTPISTIPDTCTNISYLFANTNITDISGLTFGSGINNATSWLSPKITTANNVTIKNNYVKFNGCNTLVTCDNFTFTGTDMSEMFNNCNKLQSVKNIRTNNRVINYSSLFKNCSSLGEIDFVNIDFTSTTVINYMLQSLKSGATIKNIKFGSNITASGMNNWLSGSLKNIENVHIASNAVAVNFKGNDNLGNILNSITGVTFSTNVTDITEMLSGASKITEDFIIPSHITNCTECFKNCISMTHVHSNWKNTYTNGITSTYCYFGCTEITHIDGVDIGKSEYVNGLDDIPPSWGGYGMSSQYTAIVKFDVAASNLVLALGGIFYDDKIIDWGDGTITYGESSHTYSSAGTYVVKGKYWFSNSNLTWRNYMTHIIKIPYGVQINIGWGLRGPKLIEANLNNGIVDSLTGTFADATLLRKVTFNNTTVKSGAINSIFASCKAMEAIDFAGIKIPKITNISQSFRTTSKLTTINMSALDLSGVTNTGNAFAQATELTNITFGKNLAISIAFDHCNKLTHDSLMSIINNLATVTTTQTLTIGSTNIAKLSSDEIAIAVNKGWTVN